jgi:hypothetical protein
MHEQSSSLIGVGEKSYHDNYQASFFTDNPYRYNIISPYGNNISSWNMVQSPSPRYYSLSVQQTIQMNTTLNNNAQRAIDAREPSHSIWEIEELDSAISNLAIATPSRSVVPEQEGPLEKVPEKKGSNEKESNEISLNEKGSDEIRKSMLEPLPRSSQEGSSREVAKPSKLSGLRKALRIKSTEEKAIVKIQKRKAQDGELRNEILKEEIGRWPNQEWRQIVASYQEKVGMTRKIATLRARQPIQYLHLLRAGYFEPIPVAWANLASNPLKFSIEASAGWRGITPAWRGYEDTAEERLYWVLNHREGSVGARLKPDLISALDMAKARMASAVEPPPVYFSPNDTCHVQHTSEGYSKQVMPAPFIPFDAPETALDDTMILLDVSGSMDFEPVRPIYNGYLITSYTGSTQPKNKGNSLVNPLVFG